MVVAAITAGYAAIAAPVIAIGTIVRHESGRPSLCTATSADNAITTAKTSSHHELTRPDGLPEYSRPKTIACPAAPMHAPTAAASRQHRGRRPRLIPHRPQMAVPATIAHPAAEASADQRGVRVIGNTPHPVIPPTTSRALNVASMIGPMMATTAPASRQAGLR